MILSDTVGFVSDLPTELIAAFRATLEEVREADLLIHVRNMAHPDREAQREDVEDVLKSLGLGGGGAPADRGLEQGRPSQAEERRPLLAEAQRRDDVVPISAITGEGLDALRERMAEKLRSGEQVHQIRLAASDGEQDCLAAFTRRSSRAEGRSTMKLELSVRLSPDNWARFQALESA